MTYHHDQINSVTALTDHTGAVAEQTNYSAFGELKNQTGSTSNILGYTGREHDEEANLIYYRARFYDPEVGRFISEDPLGFEAGVNFYAYVQNNPVMFNDPMGAAARSAAIKYLAQKAVNLAWKMEQKLVQVTGKGTRAWSPDELALLAKGEKISGYQGHHINSVGDFSDMAGDPANINFLTRAEHFAKHEYNWQTQTEGSLIDRTLGGKIVGIGATALFGVAGFLDTVAEAADYADPVSAFLKVLTPVDAGSGSDIIPTPNYTLLNGLSSSNSSAGGGFVIYPNKPNTNMMTQIYSK